MSLYKQSEQSVLDSLGGLNTEVSPESMLDDSNLVPATREEVIDTSNNSHTTGGKTSAVEEKALQLLGAGVTSEQVASALGVTPSRIAQLMSQKYFSDKVSALRYKALTAHNKRDGNYDSLEDKLLEKLDKALPLMIRPDTILKAMQVVNSAKRRGSSAPQSINNTQNVVNLILPSVITQKFATDINNQVIKAGDQSLLTMPSSQLLKVNSRAEEEKELSNELSSERSNP